MTPDAANSTASAARAPFALTPVQHAMACAALRAPRSGVDVEQWAVTLSESVDAASLRLAWRTIVARYSALRTAIDFADPAAPRQFVVAAVEGEWIERDWSALDTDERMRRWEALLDADRRRGFDLAEPPLWRVALVRTAPTEHRLLVTYHHVLLDGRSLVVLGRAWFAEYDRLIAGERREVSDEGASDVDRRRAFVESAARFDAGAACDFWRARLADFVPPPLPLDRSRTIDGAAKGGERRTAECAAVVAAATVDAGRRLAAEREVTLHTLVQAAWGLTLAAFTGAEDHVFGSVRACRKGIVAEADDLVGMLIHTVPLRVNLDGATTVGDLLRQVREQQLAVRPFETSPPTDVARWTSIPAADLFPTLVMFTDQPAESVFCDAAGSPHPTRSAQLLERSDFALALSAVDHRGLTLKLEYDRELYESADAAALLSSVERYLSVLTCDAEARLAQLSLVDGAVLERLRSWSAPVETPPIIATPWSRFVEQVRLRPAAPAVVEGEEAWTYAELSAAVAAMSDALRRSGVAAGDRVGIAAERGTALLAGVLSCWRLGAVYVPLDPKYPTERLRFVVDDIEPKRVLAAAAAAARLHLADAQVLDLDRLWNDARRASAALEADVAGPDPAAPAAVLYTSGSTGAPKGVVLTHRNLSNHQAYVLRTLGLGPGDRLAPVSSISFDASLEEMFCTLAGGATVVFPAADTLASFPRFIEFIERSGLTILDLPTSLWRELTNYLEEAGREYPACVRLIFMGGERATRTAYERFLKAGGRRLRWINAYGPTETSIFSTAYEHAPDVDARDDRPPPIGRPIDNTWAYVVDRRGRLVPPGVAGELLLGGAGVGEGYWRRPELTAERFIPAPSSEVAPGRYYRTGDVVRRRRDGVLEYVGRADDQVKLRGFRIEPAEIERRLAEHPAVRDVAVTVHRGEDDLACLAAYVVVRPGASFDREALRSYAARHLPEYMVPTAWMQLDALPLSPHGKTAYRALPEPWCAAASADDREPTDFERLFLDAWRRTLKLDRVGLHDDFFLHGGDSLKAMSLAARLEALLGRPVSLSGLYQTRTPAETAARFSTVEADPNLAPLVLLRDGDRRRPLFLVHSLGGDAWIYCELVRELRTDAAVYGVQLRGLNQAGTTPADLKTCAAEYLELIRTVQPEGPYRLGGYSSGGLLALEIAAQARRAGELIEFVGLIDTGLPTKVENRHPPSSLARLRDLMLALPEAWRELRSLGLGERCRKVVRFAMRQLRRLWPRADRGGEAEFTDDELFSFFAEDISVFPAYRIELIKRHLAAIEAYDPAAYDGAARLFRSARQPLFSAQSPTLGWERVVRGRLQVDTVAGAHATMMRPPHVVELAAAIDRALTAEVVAVDVPALV